MTRPVNYLTMAMAMPVDMPTHDERLAAFEDAIEEWHRSDSEQSLHEHLGLTWEQYCDYVEHGDVPESWEP